ncbi:MAG: FecR domain-containing protein [Pseudomonadota bacterium]
MASEEDAELARQAARVFLRLQDSPDSLEAQRARDAFVARGAAEARAYERVATAWTATQKKPPSRGGGAAVVLLLAIGLGLFAGYEPLRLHLLADATTGTTPERLSLASGDIAYLDAATAVSDATSDDVRRVELLSGSAYFDVTHLDRPFVVSSGGLEVEVLGTEFEVMTLAGATIVSVAEGRVEVRADGMSWRLSAGQSLRVPGDARPEVLSIPVETIAVWRQDRWATDGASVADVAAMIDRRLDARVVIPSRALRRSEIAGGFDLSNPLQALRTLAAAQNARVVAALPGVLFLVPNR